MASTKKLFGNNKSYITATFFAIFLILTIFKVFFPQSEFYINRVVVLESETNSLDNDYKVVYLGNQQITCYTTVVTTLFQFGKSKHSSGDYDVWSTTMIKSMGAPIVAFIDFNWEKKFLERAKEFNLTGIVYISKSIWDIMSEFERVRKKDYLKAYREHQWELDGEKAIHSPELYAVWNLKTYLLTKIAQRNPFKSKFFIYTDSGAWRDKQFSNWPDQSIVQSVANKLGDRILYGQVGNPNMNDFTIYRDLIQGTFFAGTFRAIAKAYENFYTLHDEWLTKGLFVGKDQTLMNELAFIRANSSIARLKTLDLKCKSWYNSWFYYQYFFAHQNEYICNEDRLSLLLFST